MGVRDDDEFSSLRSPGEAPFGAGEELMTVDRVLMSDTVMSNHKIDGSPGLDVRLKLRTFSSLSDEGLSRGTEGECCGIVPNSCWRCGNHTRETTDSLCKSKSGRL